MTEQNTNSNAMAVFIEQVEIANIQTTLNKITSMQTVLQRVLKQGQDYDTIPGTQKPTLLKPGAEKILMIFGLKSEYEIISEIEDFKNGIFAYKVRCIISKGDEKITEGLGECNSKEDKYRYRWVYERDLPLGVDKETLKKNDYSKYRIENDEIYSQVNTLLKMAKKRAQVDAVLTVGSLSDLFTQDLEDMRNFIEAEKVENMGSDDANKVVVSFGKYKGKTLDEVLTTDRQYVKWISENAKVQALRHAAKLLLNQDAGVDKKADNETQDDEEWGMHEGDFF